MKRVYLDNGSTSFPKAPGVSDAVKNFMDNVGTNVNRGGYEEAYAAEDIIIETREKLCKLFHFDKLRNVIFTPSITYSLNYIIKGYLRPGDHVLVSSMEHNAMMRPLQQVKQLGVEFDRIPCTRDGELMVDKIEEMIRPNTKAIMMLHASNVCGTVMPLQEAISATNTISNSLWMLHRRQVPFLLIWSRCTSMFWHSPDTRACWAHRESADFW